VGLNRALVVTAALTAWSAGLHPGAALAQGVVESAHLSAEFSAQDRTALVRIEYRLSLEAPIDVDVQVLGFADATVSEFEIDGIGGATELVTLSGSRRSATIPASSLLTADVVRLTYLVRNAVEDDEGALHARIPVLSVSLPPTEAVSDLFSAELSVPPDWAVSEGFPTGLRRLEDGTYGTTLAVVPALVSVRARADGVWRPGLPLGLDLLAMVVLLAFGYQGWIHLRKVAA
jgi:hypothetical protein